MVNGGPLGFTGLIVDRADGLRGLVDRISDLAVADGARLLRLAGLDPFLTEDGELHWDTPGDRDPASELLFLGLTDGIPLFAPLDPPVQSTDFPRNAFTLVDQMAPRDAALWGMARSLIGWHGRNRFCGNCGAATVPAKAGWARQCENCDSEHFPRVDPVVIMLAEYRGRILLGRQPRFPPRRYSALAGFVEHGESIEEAVARELAEEAGVAAIGVDYVCSQPWPFPGQLMIGCHARVASDELRLDPHELEDAIWVDREEARAALAGDDQARFLPPPGFAIAHALLERWVHDARRKGQEAGLGAGPIRPLRFSSLIPKGTANSVTRRAQGLMQRIFRRF